VIDKIEKIVKEDDSHENNGLLNFFKPMPKQLEGTTSPGSSAKKPQPMVEGFDNWYDWRCENWSTKWEVCEFYGVDRQYLTEQSEGESMISFAFSSAWSPPIGAYEYFLAKNEECTLKAHYYEGGCDFMGVFENGDDRCYQPSNYNSDSKFFESGDGWELDDYFGITESMAEWEAEQEAEKEDVTEYVKGKAINIGEDV